MNLSLYVYVIIDSGKSVWVGLAKSTETPLTVDGLRDREGQPFEAQEMPAYQIPAWCMELGLWCVVTKRTIEVEFPE